MVLESQFPERSFRSRPQIWTNIFITMLVKVAIPGAVFPVATRLKLLGQR